MFREGGPTMSNSNITRSASSPWRPVQPLKGYTLRPARNDGGHWLGGRRQSVARACLAANMTGNIVLLAFCDSARIRTDHRTLVKSRRVPAPPGAPGRFELQNVRRGGFHDRIVGIGCLGQRLQLSSRVKPAQKNRLTQCLQDAGRGNQCLLSDS